MIYVLHGADVKTSIRILSLVQILGPIQWTASTPAENHDYYKPGLHALSMGALGVYLGTPAAL